MSFLDLPIHLSVSGASSPVKPRSSVLKSVSSPLVACSTGSTYPASCSFDDISMLQCCALFDILLMFCIFWVVPVYDGHATEDHLVFTFSDADFRHLSAWPLYRGGATEVPLDAVVSVGYMLGTYHGNSGPVLSSNIQFLILLATA